MPGRVLSRVDAALHGVTLLVDVGLYALTPDGRGDDWRPNYPPKMVEPNDDGEGGGEPGSECARATVAAPVGRTACIPRGADRGWQGQHHCLRISSRVISAWRGLGFVRRGPVATPKPDAEAEGGSRWR